MNSYLKCWIIVAAGALALAKPASCLSETGIWEDPPASLQPPALMDEIWIPSRSERMNGLIYEAAGSGPRSPIPLRSASSSKF